jgi:hypothetical protein
LLQLGSNAFFIYEKNAQNEEDFISTLEELKDTRNYDYLIDTLLKNVNQNMKDGIILGVVVTGTNEELLKIKQDKHIRAISLGAVATEY